MAEDVDYRWKGAFGNVEVNALHVEAFQTRGFTADEWNWQTQLAEHGFGWVTARHGDRLVGWSLPDPLPWPRE
jgi:hypothetical protein